MESTKKPKTKKLKKKLLNKYRLVILNEDTFEERLSFKLTRLNVFILSSIAAILLIAGTILLIAFTPLREYIPGYSSTALKRQAVNLNYKTDSLQKDLTEKQRYYESIRKVLTGEISTVDFNKDSIIEAAKLEVDEQLLLTTKEDSMLREKVANEDKYNFFESENSTFVLFPPARGVISQNYNIKDKHYGVDVVLPENTPIKATADGVVVFAEWTTEAGYVIILEHKQSAISVYKHNASLTKNQGELVKAGEVIALSGNSGELTTGPHLHFEIWSDGYPINPTNFIDFE